MVEGRLVGREVMECGVCEKELFSGLGEGCRMCGMPLEGLGLFCCGGCEEKFGDVNEGRRIVC